MFDWTDQFFEDCIFNFPTHFNAMMYQVEYEPDMLGLMDYLLNQTKLTKASH